jgi:hypothetical protein
LGHQGHFKIAGIFKATVLLLKLNLPFVDSELAPFFVRFQLNFSVPATNKDFTFDRFDYSCRVVVDPKENNPVGYSVRPLHPKALLLVVDTRRKIVTGVFRVIDVLLLDALATYDRSIIGHSECDQAAIG